MIYEINTSYGTARIEIDSARHPKDVEGVIELYLDAAVQHLTANKAVQDVLDIRILDYIRKNADVIARNPEK